MRTLHVAAMPYPSAQGTQALIHQMLSALAAAGHETHLLCYRHGAFPVRAPRYAVHRIAAGPGQVRTASAGSLRSGPSFAKLAQDALLARALAERFDALRPDAVIAHHVEAALAALAARVQPWVFVAHTSLATELPSYFPRLLRAPLAQAGAALDGFLCRRAARVLSVSPLLAEQLHGQGAPRVFPIGAPWPSSPPQEVGERARARAILGLSSGDEVVLYAGNLDAYQGLEPLLEGLSRLARQRPALRLLLATASDPRALQRSLRGAALGTKLKHASIAGETQRRALHAAADVVVVPRAAAGGVSVKLLDALGRGSAVIAAQRAAAGLPLGAACTLLDGADCEAWRSAIDAHFRQPIRGLSLPDGRALLARDHSPRGFAAELVRHIRALPSAASESVYDARSAGGDIVPSVSGHREGDTFS